MEIAALRSSFEKSWRKIRIFLPFIWPKSFELKIYFLLSLVILFVSSVINFYTPIYSKKIVDSLLPRGNEEPEFRWDFICIYSLLKYLRSIDDFKDIFWSKIDHNVNKEIEISVFSHIQNLSIRWHLNRKTGEVIQIMSNSRHCVSYLLNLSVLTLIPAIVDVIFIMGFFTYLFDMWFIIILCICLIFYCEKMVHNAIYLPTKRQGRVKKEMKGRHFKKKKYL